MSASRQGSASYTIVIGGLTALVVGAMVLTFMIYPIVNSFMDAAFWSLDTVPGNWITTFCRRHLDFSGVAIVLIAITIYIWVRTRQ